jgi:hypothetical protein
VADHEAFAGTRPISWPLATLGAVFFLGLMFAFFLAIPSLFATSDPAQFTKIITIAYVVMLFGVVAWLVAAWQNDGQAKQRPLSHRVSVFGRPMRQGPGFASFAEKATPAPQHQPTRAKNADVETVENASSFGRPTRKRSR